MVIVLDAGLYILAFCMQVSQFRYAQQDLWQTNNEWTGCNQNWVQVRY
jgi:hypothetical protein